MGPVTGRRRLRGVFSDRQNPHTLLAVRKLWMREQKRNVKMIVLLQQPAWLCVRVSGGDIESLIRTPWRGHMCFKKPLLYDWAHKETTLPFCWAIWKPPLIVSTRTHACICTHGFTCKQILTCIKHDYRQTRKNVIPDTHTHACKTCTKTHPGQLERVCCHTIAWRGCTILLNNNRENWISCGLGRTDWNACPKFMMLPSVNAANVSRFHSTTCFAPTSYHGWIQNRSALRARS